MRLRCREGSRRRAGRAARGPSVVGEAISERFEAELTREAESEPRTDNDAERRDAARPTDEHGTERAAHYKR